MKRAVLFVLIIGIAGVLFAQQDVPPHRFASGNWSFTGPRLYQNDEAARLAKVNFDAPQSGAMIYEFNGRYEGGAEDGHGGFGIHIFVDSALNAASWGAGRSYLIWLNYDEAPGVSSIPAGFSAQIYRSTSNSRMDLVESLSLDEHLPWLLENLDRTIPFRILADGNSGEVRIYDPSSPGLEHYFFFNIDPRDLPLRGNHVAVRTNGMRVSLGMGLE